MAFPFCSVLALLYKNSKQYFLFQMYYYVFFL